MPRKFPRRIKRIVIKVGSGLISTDQMRPSAARMRSLVSQIAELRRQGVEVLLVSSGAIVLGMGQMKCVKRPAELASLQSLASIGQNILMRKYHDLFEKNNLTCAQVLLTWDDFDQRARHQNMHDTIETLLSWGVVPVINENDAISNDEIKFGDNDRLSALVASLCAADLLIILSDVKGLYDLNSPDKKVFTEVKKITKDIEDVASGTLKKDVSKGGMRSKIDAVKIAAHSKIPSVIAHGEAKNILPRIVSGERVGTFFFENEEKLIARKHWIAFGVKPKGLLIVDDGAKRAILDSGKSLLLPGVTAWEGQFKKEDVVLVKDTRGQEIARGISHYSTVDLMNITDKKGKLEVIHRDDMVINCQF